MTAQANDQDFESRYEDLTLSIAEVTGVELSSAAYDACETLGDLECALRPHLNRGGDGHSLRQRAERDVRQVIAEALGRDAADIQPTDRLIDLVPAPKRKRLRRTLERSGLVLPAPLSPERYWSPNKWIDGIAVVVVWCFFVFALFLLPVFEISRWWTVPILLAGVLLASVIAVAFRKGSSRTRCDGRDAGRPSRPGISPGVLVGRAVLRGAADSCGPRLRRAYDDRRTNDAASCPAEPPVIAGLARGERPVGAARAAMECGAWKTVPTARVVRRIEGRPDRS